MTYTCEECDHDDTMRVAVEAQRRQNLYANNKRLDAMYERMERIVANVNLVIPQTLNDEVERLEKLTGRTERPWN